MAVYSVHVRGADLSGLAEAAFLRQGFAWGAFWFGPLWLSRKGLWLALVIWAALFLILLVLGALGLLSLGASLTLVLLLQLLLGLEANHLLEVKLEGDGYHFVEIIAARAADAAEVAFYRQFEADEKGRIVASQSSHRDVLGMVPEAGGRR